MKSHVCDVTLLAMVIIMINRNLLLHPEGTSKVSCKCDFSKVSDYNGSLSDNFLFINYFESFLINKERVFGNNIIEKLDKIVRSKLC